MDLFAILFVTGSLLWICFHVLKSNFRPAKLPPGPYPYPIIGNILQLGQNPHLALAKLAETYGPLMYLKLGAINTIVVSSPELSEQVLKKHDKALSGRHIPVAFEIYNSVVLKKHDKALSGRHIPVAFEVYTSLVWTPANHRWRVLRKICKDHMFSVKRLDESQGLRRAQLRKLCDYVQDCCRNSWVVGIADAAFTTSLNLISATMFSMDLAEYSSDSSHEFKETVHGMMRIAGTPNVADYFPILKCVDPQGVMPKTEAYVRKLLETFDDIIEKRLQSVELESKNDLLEALLDLSRKNEFELTRNDILHLLLDLFIAGTDTTATTVEWAMAELIRNPKKMTKARNELHTVIGQKGQIEESDISKLPYLQALLKETFRIHPPVPLLVPHKAEADAEINGFIIPKNAQILINIWASSRDSSIWPNPDSFEPERFLDSKIDFKGQDFELIPFGSGRRICPGLPLAYRMVHLMVATLIHSFDWNLEGGIKPQELNMDEKFELSLQKAMALKAVPINC